MKQNRFNNNLLIWIRKLIRIHFWKCLKKGFKKNNASWNFSNKNNRIRKMLSLIRLHSITKTSDLTKVLYLIQTQWWVLSRETCSKPFQFSINCEEPSNTHKCHHKNDKWTNNININNLTRSNTNQLTQQRKNLTRANFQTKFQDRIKANTSLNRFKAVIRQWRLSECCNKTVDRLNRMTVFCTRMNSSRKSKM